MSAAVAATWGTAWLQFLKCFAPPGRSKWTPRRPLEGSKSIPGGSLEALGSLLAPLEGSLAVLLASRRAPGAGLEASWAQVGPILGAFQGHFFGIFFGKEFWTSFYVDLNEFWSLFRGVFLRGSEHQNQLLVRKLNMQNVLKS